MIALLEFRRQGCQYVVLECGIGGQKDATNIVDEPECSVITSIGHDHMDVIGSTLEEIAFEKAGVIKAFVPCVVGPTCADKAAIKTKAEQVCSPLISIEAQASYNNVNSSIVAAVMEVICRNQGIPAP